MRKFLLFCFTLLFLNSCVSNKKYQIELDARQGAEARESVLRNELNDAKVRVQSLTEQLTDLSRTNGTLEYINNNLRTENDELRTRISSLSSTSTSEIDQLSRRLQETSATLARRNQAIQELQTTIQERNAILQSIYNQLDSTMKVFAGDNVKTEFVDGKAIVILPSDVMFSSNSARLTRKGLEILAQLAPPLENNPNFDILIEGHTDNDKPRSRGYSDNWALSSDQAVAVARVLTKDFDIVSNQVAPVGKSEFQPRASNATSSGQAQNRRIEIVVTPKTTGLLRLMERKLSGGE